MCHPSICFDFWFVIKSFLKANFVFMSCLSMEVCAKEFKFVFVVSRIVLFVYWVVEFRIDGS